MYIPLLLAFLLTPFLTGAANSAWADQEYQLQTVAEDLDFPWSIAFLPNGDRLITELSGQLLRLDAAGNLSAPITGVPKVFRKSQGGLFDVLPDPNFRNNQMVYLSYAAGDQDSNGTTVVRARLAGNALLDLQLIFSVLPKKYAPLHYGGRMAWLPDGTLLLTTGDGFDFREQAQNLAAQLGKTIRMHKDGSAPADNPYPEHPYVWTYGHRNAQGLIVSADGTAYLHEHGARGGDEINLLVPGQNYGWPAITHGVDYNGAYVSPFTEYPGMQQPQHVWVPSIAPSGFMIYEGDMFPGWQGDLFIGALVDKEVRRLDMQDGKVVTEQALFAELNSRIRDIRQAPDGSIYVLTDGPEGEAIRVSNKLDIAAH